jgi:hypothetical protein
MVLCFTLRHAAMSLAAPLWSTIRSAGVRSAGGRSGNSTRAAGLRGIIPPSTAAARIARSVSTAISTARRPCLAEIRSAAHASTAGRVIDERGEPPNRESIRFR